MPTRRIMIPPGQFGVDRAKMINQGRKYGQELANQQGSTVCIFDSIPMDGNQTVFRFFEGANTRTFPRTNVVQNKLEDQESMTVRYAALAILTFDAVLPDQINDVQTPEDGAQPGMYGGVIHMELANTRVIKPLSLVQMSPAFNPLANNVNMGSYQFLSSIVIPPQMEFTWIVRFTEAYLVANTELCLYLYGPGAIRRLAGPA